MKYNIDENIIENIIEKIMESVLGKITEKLKKTSYYLNSRNALESLVGEYKDENFYMAMDKYLSEKSIIEKMIKDIDNYAQEEVAFVNANELAEEFYKEYCSTISYFGIAYIKQFFLRLSDVVFDLRFDVQKYSEEEKIIAHNKRNIERFENRVESWKYDIARELEQIRRTISEQKSIYNDKKFHFLEMYEGKLFLEEENAITLKDIYVMPSYKEKKEKRENLDEYLDEFMFKQNRDNVLFIVGQPSVGKSSLLADLISRYKYRNDIIAIPMKPLDGGESLLNGLRKELRCNDEDLENKILILDGFDETKIVKQKDANINKICSDFINDLQCITRRDKSLKVIMTVKTDCFDLADWEEKYDRARVIEIQDLNKDQIKMFQQKYAAKKEISNSSNRFINRSLEKKDMSIVVNPMMLYMICHYGGKIGNNLSKALIYEKIFGKEGSLFTNIYKGKGREEERGTIEKCYNMIEKLAFDIYSNNPNKLSSDEKEMYFKDNDLKRISGKMIRMWSEEDEVSIEFTHMSICYYFVAECIYNKLFQICENQKVEYELVLKTIDELFSFGKFEGEIFEFLMYFVKTRNLVKLEERNKILLNSLDYVLKRNCIHTLEHENEMLLLDRVHNSFNGYWKVFIMIYSVICGENFSLNEIVDNKIVWKNMSRLLKNGSFHRLYLRGADFSQNDLRGAILRECDLSNANLRYVDLRGASLIGTKFCNAILDSANLNGADLCKAKFRGAQLYRVKLRGSILKECDFRNSKIINEVKFSYSNIMHVKGISEEDLKKCYVYNEQGRMICYGEFVR